MHEIILAMKTDIIVATAGNKRGCYFTVHNSLKLHALSYANTLSGSFTIQYMKTIIPNMS